MTTLEELIGARGTCSECGKRGVKIDHAYEDVTERYIVKLCGPCQDKAERGDRNDN